MILTAEALAELRKERDGVFGVGTIHDLLDTIENVQEKVDLAVLEAIVNLERCVYRICPDNKAALHEINLHREMHAVAANRTNTKGKQNGPTS